MGARQLHQETIRLWVDMREEEEEEEEDMADLATVLQLLDKQYRSDQLLDGRNSQHLQADGCN